MADKLHFDLVSPERLLLSENVDMVTVPGKEGDFGVLADHAPVLAVLRPGVINVDDAGRDQQRIFVRGGFAEVTPAGLTILAEMAIPLSEVDAAVLDAQIADVQEDVNDAKTDEARDAAQQELGYLKALRQEI